MDTENTAVSNILVIVQWVLYNRQHNLTMGTSQLLDARITYFTYHGIYEYLEYIVHIIISVQCEICNHEKIIMGTSI